NKGGIRGVVSSVKSGSFNLVLHDKKKNLLYILNDRFGLKPMYYFLGGDVTIFASEMKLILPFLEELNVDFNGISDFLFYKFIIGDKTFIENVRLLSRASLVKIDLSSGKTKCDRYWSIKHHGVPS
ncbi:unnamed protein product, partial [marine sediment metagenome]